MALAICADTTHPEHAEAAAAQGAGIYAAGVLITHKGYEPDAALMQQYALKHQMAVVMANYPKPTGGWIPAGKSAIWSKGGVLVASASEDEEALVLAEFGDGDMQGGTVLLSFVDFRN